MKLKDCAHVLEIINAQDKHWSQCKNVFVFKTTQVQHFIIILVVKRVTTKIISTVPLQVVPGAAFLCDAVDAIKKFKWEILLLDLFVGPGRIVNARFDVVRPVDGTSLAFFGGLEVTLSEASTICLGVTLLDQVMCNLSVMRWASMRSARGKVQKCCGCSGTTCPRPCRRWQSPQSTIVARPWSSSMIKGGHPAWSQPCVAVHF